MSESEAATNGVDHVGLAVHSLEKSTAFFVEALGWRVVGGNPDYPSAYVSDGAAVVTIWQVADPEKATPFDRRHNVGLHHLAFKITSSDALDALFDRIKGWPGLEIEFAPEFSGQGPKRHFMVYEPGGNRIEFSWDPRRKD